MAGKVGLEVIQELHTGQNFDVRIVRVGEIKKAQIGRQNPAKREKTNQNSK